jgi:hypothetical protein
MAVAIACATVPVASDGPADEGAMVTVMLENTTHTCVEPAPILVETPRGTLEAAPGASLAVRLSVGTQQVRVRRAGAETFMLQTWAVPPATPLFVGCADPRFLSPSPGSRPLRLEHRAHGCEAGVRGPLVWESGGTLLAVVPPGQSAERHLPAGLPAPAAVVAGCTPTPGRLTPLTVIYRPGGCEGPPRDLEVEAAARRQTLHPGEAWTLYLPRATYRIRVDGQELYVELGKAGQVIQRTACAPRL